jgi:hydantoinase/carbamoylase family amidase
MTSEPLIARSVTASLDELARIGGDAEGGVTRVAWSPELLAAYDTVAAWMEGLGLETDVDAAGNLLGRWQAGSGPAVMVGSHLDTVPAGGRLDGVLGVVAAVHAVAQLKDEGYEPARPLWIAAFMDEEGTRFGTALFGSRAFAGENLSALGSRRDRTGVTLRAAMAEAGFDFDQLAAARRIDEVALYLELHIEQGPVLEAEELDLGIVTSIVGLRGYRVRLHGQANHAGTTPHHLRRDALAGAARIVLALREEIGRQDGMTSNVGKLTVEPGGSNVIPGLVDFTIDVRATRGAELSDVERTVAGAVERIAAEEGLQAELEQTYTLDPLELDATLVDALERAAATEGAAARRMASGAGHDAMVIGRHVPAGMLFAPSLGGISHSPAEESRPEQIELGVRVLASSLREFLRAA